MNMQEALIDIEIAFLQLEFAIKLLTYCEEGKIQRPEEEFDTDHIVQEENLYLPAGRLNTQEEIEKAAGISLLVAIGASAIILYEALNCAGYRRNPNSEHEIERLCALVYMVRCAYAHGMSDPKWHAHKNQMCIHRVNLPSGPLMLNLAELNGKRFEYRHIGNLGKWLEIRDASVKAIKATIRQSVVSFLPIQLHSSNNNSLVASPSLTATAPATSF